VRVDEVISTSSYDSSSRCLKECFLSLPFSGAWVSVASVVAFRVRVQKVLHNIMELFSSPVMVSAKMTYARRSVTHSGVEAKIMGKNECRSVGVAMHGIIHLS